MRVIIDGECVKIVKGIYKPIYTDITTIIPASISKRVTKNEETVLNYELLQKLFSVYLERLKLSESYMHEYISVKKPDYMYKAMYMDGSIAYHLMCSDTTRIRVDRSCFKGVKIRSSRYENN